MYQTQDDLLPMGPLALGAINSPALSHCSVMRSDYLNVIEGLGSREAVNKNYDEKVCP